VSVRERDNAMTRPAVQPGFDPVALGRRRAQLLRGADQPGPADARTAPPAQALSLADVEELRSNPSTGTRAALAAKFGRQYDSLIEGGTRSLAESVLLLLVRDLEKSVRQALAETVAASPQLPHAIAMRMARDEIEVARLVLERSPVLGDDDLAEIVRTHAMQYALAVAGREHLSEYLSEIVADAGDAEVIARLVGNAGAQISIETLTRMAEDYREDRGIQDRLVRRPALPYELVDRMVAEIGERLEWELVRKRRMTSEEARQLMAATRERATINIVAREHGERSLERELRERLTIGELGPEQLLTYLRDGEISRFEAGIALLADIDLRRARQLLYGVDRRGLAALAARAGFATPHYVALRMTLDLAERGVKGTAPHAPYGEDTMRFIQDQYEQIRTDPALIGHWVSQ
jgi:uncharacterized protein (DUF2336 family)